MQNVVLNNSLEMPILGFGVFQGASVVLGARRVNRIEALADELNSSGGKALAIATDVTHHNQVKRLVKVSDKEYQTGSNVE